MFCFSSDLFDSMRPPPLPEGANLAIFCAPRTTAVIQTRRVNFTFAALAILVGFTFEFMESVAHIVTPKRFLFWEFLFYLKKSSHADMSTPSFPYTKSLPYYSHTEQEKSYAHCLPNIICEVQDDKYHPHDPFLRAFI